MILVDTSIWVDHLRHGDGRLTALLARRRVAIHPFVVGEIALGGAKPIVIENLKRLPRTAVARDDEVLEFILRHPLPGRGIGYVDAHLLAAARLMPAGRLWTRDKRLAALAESLGVSEDFGEPPT